MCTVRQYIIVPNYCRRRTPSYFTELDKLLSEIDGGLFFLPEFAHFRREMFDCRGSNVAETQDTVITAGAAVVAGRGG